MQNKTQNLQKKPQMEVCVIHSLLLETQLKMEV